MKKLIDFLKSNILIVKWTLGYFIFLWVLLKFLFNFNMLSSHQWWKFSHATLHGFGGLVFGVIIYSMIPIYLATTLIIYRKKTPIIAFPFIDKIKAIFEKIKKWFVRPAPAPAPAPATTEQQPTESEKPASQKTPEYPTDMPCELYIPYLRAKQNIPMMGPVSTFNQDKPTLQKPEQNENENKSFPIPSDFDIADDDFETNTSNELFSGNDFPVFKDIDFDTPIKKNIPENKPENLINSATKYFDAHNVEYETYHDFVATEKYIIYDHNDSDFWILDDETWFASGKSIESPIPELLNLAKQNDLVPVLFLESQNIMDLPGTTERFESVGIRVIKKLEELD